MYNTGRSNVAFKKRQVQVNKQYLYNQVLITKKVTLNITAIGNNIKETLEKTIASQIEGKCIVEGYVQPNTTEIITYSSGLIHGNTILFEVVFKCNVCAPVEGMLISCVAKNINKMGIRAETQDQPSPVVIFISRDHNYNSPLFAQVQVNDEVKVRVIGQRYELNDKYISIIAELTEIQNDAAANAPPVIEVAAAAAPAIQGEGNSVKPMKRTIRISKKKLQTVPI